MTEMDEAKKLGYLYPSSSPGKLKMRARYQDCADCLCRVCSRSVLNDSHNYTPVSYTHLDVYKRQEFADCDITLKRDDLLFVKMAENV